MQPTLKSLTTPPPAELSAIVLQAKQLRAEALRQYIETAARAVRGLARRIFHTPNAPTKPTGMTAAR